MGDNQNRICNGRFYIYRRNVNIRFFDICVDDVDLVIIIKSIPRRIKSILRDRCVYFEFGSMNDVSKKMKSGNPEYPIDPDIHHHYMDLNIAADKYREAKNFIEGCMEKKDFSQEVRDRLDFLYRQITLDNATEMLASARKISEEEIGRINKRVREFRYLSLFMIVFGIAICLLFILAEIYLDKFQIIKTGLITGGVTFMFGSIMLGVSLKQ